MFFEWWKGTRRDERTISVFPSQLAAAISRNNIKMKGEGTRMNVVTIKIKSFFHKFLFLPALDFYWGFESDMLYWEIFWVVWNWWGVFKSLYLSFWLLVGIGLKSSLTTDSIGSHCCLDIPKNYSNILTKQTTAIKF